jgi:hypothetical protein
VPVLARVVTVCVLALAALAPSACGGVLVPADPPARTAETIAAGGDVIVFNRERKSFALVARGGRSPRPRELPGARARKRRPALDARRGH